MSNKNDLIKNVYFEIGLKSNEGHPRERVLHVKNLIGTEQHGKNGMISTERHLHEFDLEELFGYEYRKENIRYVKKVSETESVMLVLNKLEYS